MGLGLASPKEQVEKKGGKLNFEKEYDMSQKIAISILNSPDGYGSTKFRSRQNSKCIQENLYSPLKGGSKKH